MIKVITYNNRWDLYSKEYEDKTRSMIKRHMTIPHIHRHYVAPHGDSWYIIELFKHEPFLLVALDAVVVGSLNECVNFNKLTAIEEWKLPGEPNTSLMWVTGVGKLYDKFQKDKEKIKENYPWVLHAEQRWLRDNADIDFYPRGWGTSYKYDGKPKKDTKIVVFHGKPKPHEVKDEWVKDNWK